MGLLSELQLVEDKQRQKHFNNKQHYKSATKHLNDNETMMKVTGQHGQNTVVEKLKQFAVKEYTHRNIEGAQENVLQEI